MRLTISIVNSGGVPSTRVDQPIGAQHLSVLPLRKPIRGEQKFNGHQTFLYKRAINGIRFYTKQEACAILPKKRMNIEKVQRKTQRILNIWKQQICNDLTNSLFLSLFPRTQFAKDLIEKFGEDVDPEFINTLEFRDLGVSKVEIADKLIKERILPKNFYQLEDDRDSPLENF